MPATNIPVVTATRSGVTWPATDGTAADVANGNSVTNGPSICVLVFNGAAGSSTVTFKTPNAPGGLAIADDVKTLAAGERKVYGPFPTNLFGDVLEFTGSVATVKFIPFQHE